MMDDDDQVAHAQIPTSFGHELRACLRCRLVKTYDQFRENGCENCPFLEMQTENDNVVNCTTPNFTGIISLMDPSRSWAARWLMVENWGSAKTTTCSTCLPSVSEQRGLRFSTFRGKVTLPLDSEWMARFDKQYNPYSTMMNSTY